MLQLQDNSPRPKGSFFPKEHFTSIFLLRNEEDGCNILKAQCFIAFSPFHSPSHYKHSFLSGFPIFSTYGLSPPHSSYQQGRGQAIRWEVTLQIRRQLQGHRTYFFPGGAFLIGQKITATSASKPLMNVNPFHFPPKTLSEKRYRNKYQPGKRKTCIVGCARELHFSNQKRCEGEGW